MDVWKLDGSRWKSAFGYGYSEMSALEIEGIDPKVVGFRLLKLTRKMCQHILQHLEVLS